MLGLYPPRHHHMRLPEVRIHYQQLPISKLRQTWRHNFEGQVIVDLFQVLVASMEVVVAKTWLQLTK